MRKLRRTLRKMAWAVYLLALALARHAEAQTVSASFTGTSAPGWMFASANTNTFIPFLTAPSIDANGQGWLRLTDNNQNESTYALYTAGSITGAGRSIYASFDFTFWNTGGIGPADGLTFFLYDAAVPFSVGAYGGSLGYANRSGINGLAGGYLGIGLDVFGNYSNPTEGRNGGPGFLPNQVVVRGPGSGQSGYAYIVGTGNASYPSLNPTTQNLNFATNTSRPLQSGASYRHASMTLSPAGILDVYLQFGAGTSPVLVMAADLSSYTRPAQLGFGYTASTGSGAEYTELRNFTATSVVGDTWSNSGGSTLWSDNNSWTPHSVPISGTQVIFDNTYASSSQLVQLSGATNSVSSISFDAPFLYHLTNGVVNFTNGTPGALGIDATHLNGNGAITLDVGITTTGDLNIQNYGGGTLTANGTMSLGTNNVFFSGSIDTVVNGVISGSGYLSQLGTNVLWLNAANTYSGGTILQAGTISIGNSNALGSGTFTIDGGAIQAGGGSQTITNNITLVASTAISGANNLTLNGTLLNCGTNNTITLNNTGTTTLGGNVTLSESSAQRSLTFNGTGNATINGSIGDGSSAGSGGSSLVMSGTGNLTLGATTNSYSGGTIINSGTITLGHSGALNNNGSLTLSGGTLNLNGKNQIVGQLSFNNGSIDMGTAGGNYFGFNSASTNFGGNLNILDYKPNDLIGVVQTNLPGASYLNSIYFSGYGAGAVVVSNNVAFGGYGSGWDILAPSTNNIYVWNGNSIANSNWSTATNWVGNSSPPSATTTRVTFTGTQRLTPSLSANETVNVLKFDTNAGAFNLGGGSRLTMDGIFPSIIDQSPSNQIVSMRLRLLQTTIFDVSGAGNLTISGAVDDNGTGNGGVDKRGGSTLILTGNNSFGGTNTIEAGVVNIQNNNALGNNNNPTTVNAGGALELQNNLNNVNLPLTLNGLGTNNSGALRSVSGNNVVNGAITLGSDSRINTDAGTLTLSGGIASSSNNTLYLGGSGNTTVNSQLGAGGLIKDGSGDVTLSNNGGNVIPGATTVNGGILDLADSNSSNLTTGTNVFINNGGTVRLQASQQIPTTGVLTLNGTGVLNLNGFINTVGVLNSSSVGSQVQLGTGGSLQINSYQNSIFDGTVSGAGSLDKEGPNSLTLAGTNTYTGGTTIGGGIVNIQNDSALGTGSVVVSNNASLQLQGGINVGANAITLNGTGISTNGALVNINGNNSLAGKITLGSNASIVSQSGTLTDNGVINTGGNNLSLGGNGNVTLNGAITNAAGSLTDNLTGLLLLTGTNTFTGGITVTGQGTNTVGTLELDTPNANAIPSGTINLNNGATLLFGANNQLTKNVNIVSGGNATINVGSTTQTAGTLTLTGNSSILFGSGSPTISFASSTYNGWTGTLYVDNWTSTDGLRFGTNITGLGAGGPVFTNIVFVDPNGLPANYIGEINAQGWVTPVPEVGSFVYGGVLAGLVGWRHRRQIKSWLNLPAGK